MIKEEVQTKEVISKDDIQEFLVQPSMEFSHYIAFVQKIVVDMEKLKKSKERTLLQLSRGTDSNLA